MSSLAMTDYPEAPLFSDGLGERVVVADGATGELLQILRIRPALTAVASFEFALRERTARLANFRHAYYTRVRRIDRAMPPGGSLAVVSDHVEGTRLSDILRVAEERHLQLDVNAAICLMRQLVPAVAVLHENARDVAHGLIAPERLVVSPNAKLMIVEHVLGAAIEQLQYGRDRLWQEFRVAMPPSAGLPRFDHRADVAEMGLVALALLLGRPIAQDEYPNQIGKLLDGARERSPIGGERPLSTALHGWLSRTLQLDVRRAFASGRDALAAFDEVLADDSQYVAAPVALETFLSRYGAALLEPAPAPPVRDMPVPVPEPPVTVAATAAAQPVEITALLNIDDLPAPEPSPVTGPPLFNPDAPFSAPIADVRSDGPRRRRISVRTLAMAAAMVAAVGGGAVAFKYYGRVAAAPPMGTLVVSSNPSGIEVVVDGVNRGVTPARITTAPGAHILELRGRGTPRVIPLNVAPGSEVSQYLEFADAPAVGQLAVQTQPAGARVLVDGTERGVAPVTISDLTPGDHEVVLEAEGLTARHTVTIQAGGTASLMVPLSAAATGPSSGWFALKAPFTIEIREQGRLLGTTDSDRLMTTAGRHELELTNETLGYRATRVVQVPGGKVVTLPLDLPKGTLSLNATPWAEVWIDGERMGETPIGNLHVPIGPHEIVFKNPQLGEKRQAVSVTTAAPVRVSVDMK